MGAPSGRNLTPMGPDDAPVGREEYFRGRSFPRRLAVGYRTPPLPGFQRAVDAAEALKRRKRVGWFTAASRPAFG